MTDATSYLSEQQDASTEAMDSGTQIAAAGGSVAVPTPSAGERIDITVEPGQALDFGFDPASVPSLVLAEEGAVQFNFPDGGIVIIHGFQAWADAGGQANVNGQLADLAAIGVLPATAQDSAAAEQQVCETLEIPTAGPGEKLTVAAQPGQSLQLTCDLAGIQGQEVEGDLMLTFPNGGVTVIEDFAEWAAATGATLNDCNCNAQNLPDVLASLGVGPEQIEPAAGQAAGGPQGGTDVTGSGFTPHPGPEILSGLPYPHILPPTALQYGVPFVEPTFFPVDDEAPPRTVGEPSVSLDLAGEDTCVEEDSTIYQSDGEGETLNPDNVVSIHAEVGEADDELVDLVIEGFQPDWTYDFSALDSNPDVDSWNFDGATLTIIFNSGVTSFDGQFSVAPPPDSDVDHPTLTATVTAQDTIDNSVQASAQTTLDIDVDANADPVTVDITVNDGGDAGATFQTGETGSVNIKATFGDAADGSEIHTVTIDIPAGFTVGALNGLPANVTAEVINGDVVFTLGEGVTSLDYTFDVTNNNTGEANFTFTATAKADENPPSDHECDPSDEDNIATAVDTENETVRNVGKPTVGMDLAGDDDCVKEDSTTSSPDNVVTVTANAQPGDVLTQLVITGFDPATTVGSGAAANWLINITALQGHADVASATYDATTDTLTIIFDPGVTSFSGTFAVAPPANTDIDLGTLTATVTAADGVDPSVTDTGQTTLAVNVDAVADAPTVDITVNDGGDAGATFQTGETGTVNIKATFGDAADGSEIHTVLIDIPTGFTAGALNGLPAGVTATVLGNGDVEFTLGVGVTSLDYTFNVTNTSAGDGGVTFTATATANEDPTADDECDTSDNIATATDKETETVTNIGKPTVGMELAGDDDCVKEDSTTSSPDNVITVTAEAQPGDVLTQLVITGFDPATTVGSGAAANWLINITALQGHPDVQSASYDAATDTLTILFDPGVTSFTGTFAVAPPANTDVDLGTLTAEVTAADGVDPSVTDTAQTTLAVNVDAVADAPTVDITVNDGGDASNTSFQTGETGTINIKATFGDAADGSEIHTVLIDIPTGFTAGALNNLPAGVTATVLGNGDVEFTLGVGVTSLDYTFNVTNTSAPAGSPVFTATATANEDPTTDDECDTSDNLATKTDKETETVNNFPTAGTVNIVVDDEGLTGGNKGGGATDVAGEVTIVNGTLTNGGGDGPLTVDFASLDGEVIQVGTESVTLNWDPATDTLTGSSGRGDVFTIEITDPATGAYTFTLLLPTLHPAGSNENDIDIALNYTVTDSNGDDVTGTLNIKIDDDTPVQNANTLAITVEEDDMTNPPEFSKGNNEDGSVDKNVSTGSIANLFSVGADQPGSFSVSASGLPALTSKGQTVNYTVVGNTLVAYTGGDPNTNRVFTLQVLANGAYTFTLLDQIDHANIQGENNLVLDLSSAIVLTDFDGDFINLDAGSFQITVQDDIPVPFAPSTTYIENDKGKVTSDINFQEAVGADETGDVIFTVKDGDKVTDSSKNALEYFGEEIFYNVVSDYVVEGRTGDGDLAFVITLDPDTDTYTWEQFGPLLNGEEFKFENLESVGGGNKDFKALGTTDKGTPPEDILISTTKGETVNTNSSEIGVGGGQNFGEGDTARFDMLLNLKVVPVDGTNPTGFGHGGHFNIVSWKQKVERVEGGPNETTAFHVQILNADDDFNYIGDADDKVVTGFTVNVYDDKGAFQYKIVDGVGNALDGDVYLTGIEEDWTYEIVSNVTFDAVVVTGDLNATDNREMKLGAITIVTANDQDPFDILFPILGEDEDGDTQASTLVVNINPQDQTTQGDAGANNIVGDDKDNSLIGLNGNDTLAGGKGIDLLAGGNGNDSLNGGEGSDLLDGGSGSDTLTGGTGNDNFRLDGSTLSAKDVITDYAAGDVVDLTELFTVDTASGKTISNYVDMVGNDLKVDISGGGNFSTTVATINVAAVTVVFDTSTLTDQTAAIS